MKQKIDGWIKKWQVYCIFNYFHLPTEIFINMYVYLQHKIDSFFTIRNQS